jgi:hypothetical protein
MPARAVTGLATAAMMMAVLAIAPGRAARPRHLPQLAPWKPPLSVRFSGAMTSFSHPVARAGESNGVVTLMMTGVEPADLPGIRSAAARSAERVVRSCRCHMRGWEVLARLPGRGVQVVAASGASS